MDRRNRIAIYGGTFDPVHLAHVAIARRVLKLFEIDQLLFVPARHAPHKLQQEVTPPIHRYAMLALATQGDKQLLVSTFELEEDDRSYTVDTLSHFRSTVGDSAELFFIMGGDSWLELTTWYEWERLLTLSDVIVVTRPGQDLDLTSATQALGKKVIDVRGADASSIQHITARGDRPAVFFSDAVMMDISANVIRRAVLEQRWNYVKEVVPLEVAEYIAKYRLYTHSDEA